MKKTTDIDSSKAWETFISTGNEESFSLIYNDHFNLLYYVGLKYTCNRQIIEDSIQNIFVYLLKKRKKLNLVINVKAYLLKCFRRQLFLDIKEQKRFSSAGRLSDNQFDDYQGAEQAISEKEESNRLKIVIKRSLVNLSARQQEIIYLRYDCELSYEEISDILEIAVDSCYKSVYRSLKTMRTDIEETVTKCADCFF